MLRRISPSAKMDASTMTTAIIGSIISRITSSGSGGGSGSSRSGGVDVVVMAAAVEAAAARPLHLVFTRRAAGLLRLQI